MRASLISAIEYTFNLNAITNQNAIGIAL